MEAAHAAAPRPGGGAHAAHPRPLAGDALRHAVLLLGIHPGHLRPRETGSPKKATGNITLRVVLPTLRPDETLAVAGSGRELGDWKRIVPMDDSRFPEWELTLHTAHRFEYKFLIADRKTLTPILWEEGANRTWGELPGAGEHALDAAASPRFPERRWRGAGTAIPVFSLRTEEDFGVGEFYDLKRLIDWAAAPGSASSKYCQSTTPP